MAPRLREIDPAMVAERVRRRLHAEIASAHDTASDDARRTPRAPHEEMGALVEALVLYARQGLPVRHWRDRGSVADALAQVLALLYGSPDGHGVQGFLTLDRDPRDEIGVTLLAALARLQLERGEPVTARELAALAGLTTASVRLRVLSGELAASDALADEIAPESARRWLTGRGLPGFEP